jgi:hypothetical protein
MKNKSFDCIEMKRKGAEQIYLKVAPLSRIQQLEYWRKGSESLREIIARCKNTASYSQPSPDSNALFVREEKT